MILVCGVFQALLFIYLFLYLFFSLVVLNLSVALFFLLLMDMICLQVHINKLRVSLVPSD
jgi:hypothetical protein